MKTKLVLGLVMCGMLWAVTAASQDAAGPPRGPSHFVPNSQSFWDFSKNWTTNYGPAYRDTVLEPTNFLPCTGQFALCFHSGAEPLPCRLTKDGRFANCTCEVLDGLNFVLITAILNHPVYLATINQCGANGAGCQTPDTAPVCEFLANGRLIPGAQVISTYDPTVTQTLKDANTPPFPSNVLTKCTSDPPDPLPFAGCMTAPCKLTKEGTAQCLCPVFYGNFQLVGPNAQCTLGGDLVPSASYNPKHDPTVP
ncbi:MAG: hypothetical protein L0191_11950 [Acidobacteria bacterium]|nr:hypothetical protein [Acidobacteriota bacterium]